MPASRGRQSSSAWRSFSAPGEAWVSHASAARILGLPLPALPGQHVSVVAKPDRTKRRDVRSHVGDPSAPVIRRGDLVHSAPVQVFVAKDVYNTPHLTVERMARLLRAAGLRDMPRVLRDDWRAHFPVRHGYL